jgi:phosphatidylglycerophosphate synthase
MSARLPQFPRQKLTVRERGRNLTTRYFEEPAARLLSALHITPNTISILGFLIACVSAFLAYQNSFISAGFLFLLAGIFDMLDGSVARITGHSTPFGAILDSLIDRVSETALLFGLMLFYLNNDNEPGVTLVFLALASSYLVSYLRARGEGAGINMQRSGLFTRTERVLTLSIGLIINQMILALTIVAVLSTATVIQRIYRIYR